MQKPDLKKLKEKLLPRVQIPISNLKQAFAKAGAAARGGRSRFTSFAKAQKPKLESVRKKAKEALKKGRGTLLPAFWMAAGMLGAGQAILYISNPERNGHRVTFKEVEGGIVHAYPEREKLYFEKDKSYVMVDYRHKNVCRGVLGHLPGWVTASEEKTSWYSMQICRSFGQVTSDAPGLDENRFRYEKYMIEAKAQTPKLP